MSCSRAGFLPPHGECDFSSKFDTEDWFLQATLHQEKTAAKSPQEFTTLEEKMAIIGKATLHKLLDSFTAEEEDDHARVWVGQHS